MTKELVDGGFVTVPLDLTTAGIATGAEVDVSGIDKISIRAYAATWSTAVVTIKRSVRGTTPVAGTEYAVLSPSITYSADTHSWDIDVSMAGVVAFDVTTAAGGASAASVELVGRKDRDRAPPWAEYYVINPNSTNLNQLTWTQYPYDTVVHEDSDYFALESSGDVTIHKAGWYDLYATCAHNMAVVRGSVRSQFFKTAGTVALNSQCAGAYIRATAGHNEATTTMRYHFLFAEGDTVGCFGTRAAAAGSIQPWSNFCNFILRKVS